jgi:hypothetical protein
VHPHRRNDVFLLCSLQRHAGGVSSGHRRAALVGTSVVKAPSILMANRRKYSMQAAQVTE